MTDRLCGLWVQVQVRLAWAAETPKGDAPDLKLEEDCNRQMKTGRTEISRTAMEAQRGIVT